MTFNKLLLTSTISALMLAGCGGSNNSSSSNNSDNHNGNNSQQAGQEAPNTCEAIKLETRTIEGNVTCDLELDATAPWTLKGVVNIGNGQVDISGAGQAQSIKDNGYTITIEPGAEIKADQDGALIVTRGSQIFAEGTKEKPITFSSLDDGFDGSGEWGGVVIQGFAPQHAPGSSLRCDTNDSICNAQGEGGDDSVAKFGGSDAADSSGSLKYVRIAEAGKVAGPDNEINGLTLQGVGYGTELSYIQVHGNLDDGIEWFGGTANLKYAVLTNNDDDDVDFDEGYQGHIQHVLIIKHQNKEYPSGKNDPRAIEANSSDEEAVKDTNAKLANITIIGSEMVQNSTTLKDGEGNDIVFDDNNEDLRKQPGMRLRGDLTVEISNAIVVDYHDCLRIDNGQDEMTTVTFNNVITGSCEDDTIVYKATKDSKGTGTLPSSTNNNLIHLDDAGEAPELNEALAMTNANASLSSTFDPEELEGRSEFTFDNTDYAGAVDPSIEKAEDAWWYGWTIEGSTDLKQP